MKILIVDDNATNRIMLRALLEEYEEAHTVTFECSEAKDGLEAVQMCEKTEYDMVLMDINMPKMNGIEASKQIRQMYPKIMIIAISTSDDDEQRRSILDNGAEDYISKPIDANVFQKRMKNYLTLLESRANKTTSKSRFINLYSNEIYNRHTCFILDSEDALAEFWEFFLLNARAKSNYLSDVVRTIVYIVEKQMKISPINKLYIEESADVQYFTLTGIDALPSKIVELTLLKNEIKDGYKLSDSKISFELLKAKQFEDKLSEETPKVQQQQQEPKVVEMKESSALEVFEYLDPDDLIDLEEYAGRLNSLMLLVGNEITEEEILEIYTYLDRIAAILHTYSEALVISEALASLARDMRENVETFLENAEALAPMCFAFSKDMTNWIEKTFHTGAPSVDFMDDTIAVNSQTISSMLSMDESGAGDDDLDDIFDF